MMKLELACLFSSLIGVVSFTPSTYTKNAISQLHSTKETDVELFDRRSILTKPALVGMLGLMTTDLLRPLDAHAASSQEKTDKENLVKGYKRCVHWNTPPDPLMTTYTSLPHVIIQGFHIYSTIGRKKQPYVDGRITRILDAKERLKKLWNILVTNQ